METDIMKRNYDNEALWDDCIYFGYESENNTEGISRHLVNDKKLEDEFNDAFDHRIKTIKHLESLY